MTRDKQPAKKTAASSETKEDGTTKTAVDKAAVIGYLRAHPDFLANNLDLLHTQTPPQNHKGETVADFQQFMIQKLRHEQNVMKAAQRSLIETARANMTNQSRIHEAALRLLDARTLEEMIEVLTGDLTVVLGVDVCILLVDSNGLDTPQALSRGVRVVEPGYVDDVMQGQRVSLCGNLNTENDAHRYLFDEAAALIQSQALVRLDISTQTPPALLVFGSRDPEGFVEGQATELISFLGGVVERCLRAWLDLPV